jgi:hypothetical protein
MMKFVPWNFGEQPKPKFVKHPIIGGERRKFVPAWYSKKEKQNDEPARTND